MSEPGDRSEGEPERPDQPGELSEAEAAHRGAPSPAAVDATGGASDAHATPLQAVEEAGRARADDEVPSHAAESAPANVVLAPTDDHGSPAPQVAVDEVRGESLVERTDHEGATAPEAIAGVAALAGDEDDVAPLTRPPPRALGIALALAAAGLLVAACFSHRWLANKHLGNFGYSPLTFQQCGATCETLSNFQIYDIASDSPFAESRVSSAFPVAGIITFIVLLVAAAGLVVSAGIAAAGGRPNLPISPTTFALLGIMIGLISGCVFVATKPGGVGAVGVAWSFWAFGAGAVTGIAAAQLLAKQIRPSDPDLLQDAMNPDQF